MRGYGYIGTVEGYVENGIPVIGNSARFSGNVRTRILGCEDCGAAVPEGRGQEAHEHWHQELERALAAG